MGGDLDARMIRVERSVLPADETALDELVPALLAVGLGVGLRDDRNLLPLPDVSKADRSGLLTGLLVLLRPLHVAHHRGLEEERADERALVCGRGGILRGGVRSGFLRRLAVAQRGDGAGGVFLRRGAVALRLGAGSESRGRAERTKRERNGSKAERSEGHG